VCPENFDVFSGEIGGGSFETPSVSILLLEVGTCQFYPSAWVVVACLDIDISTVSACLKLFLFYDIPSSVVPSSEVHGGESIG